MSRKGRPPQTHCKRGHSLDDAYIVTRGKAGGTYRACRTCAIDRAKAHHRENYVAHPRPAPTIATDSIVLAYTAGLFDGEGSVGIREGRKAGQVKPRYHSLTVSITSTEPALTSWLQEHFGGTVNPNHRENAARNYKDAWKWQLRARHAGAFLEAILPYLIVKRPQALVGLELRKLAGQGRATPVTPELWAKREALKQEMHRLNRRGRDPETIGA